MISIDKVGQELIKNIWNNMIHFFIAVVGVELGLILGLNIKIEVITDDLYVF